MKSKVKMLALLAGALATQAASAADVTVTITGSTAFRSIVQDRVASLYDAGFAMTQFDGNIRTYSGTMSNANVYPGHPTWIVEVRMSFSGSAAGMQTLQSAATGGGNVNTVNIGGSQANVAVQADLALSDVFPGSATPPIPTTAFSKREKVGVVPFVFAKNNGSYLSGVTNITRDQGLLLMTATGIMPSSFLGGINTNATNVLYLLGRDSGSGTRICTEKCLGFVGAPFLYAHTTDGWVSTNGFSSGGTLATQLAANVESVGYLGLADFGTITNSATALAYDGIPYNTTNVLTGKYGLWGYEHLCSKIGIGANQITFRDKLVNSITNSVYQHSNANYVGKFEVLQDMRVERGADGAVITSLEW